ncbi:anti-sigma factor family protein [Streptomyces sp. NPDC089424]|uniref:anti-sigma factor family protein n=1 Tax=Streptomyces sp. NPDC089424 TaxID=3365917 RepID=UPI0037F64366
MTSRTDTAGHPDVSEISDLTEGLLPPDRTADVRRHLDECELCADVFASLEEIRGMLGTLPGPSRMPADVAERIDAALAAEALLDATAPDPADTAPGTANTTAPVAAAHTGEGADVSRETSPPATRPTGRARTSTTGPGRKERKPGRRRKVAVLGAVLSVGALGLASLLVSSMDGDQGTTAEGHHSTAPDTFAASKLEKQVTDLLAKSESGGTPRTPRERGAEPNVDSEGPRVLTKPAVPVPECVQNGIGRDDDALATEPGTYKGTTALLVVMPDTVNPAQVTAYLVDATCVEQSPKGSAEVFLKQSYAHP